MKTISIGMDELANCCGFFSEESSVGNYYNCSHPEQEIFEFDDELKKNIGKCTRIGCPLAHLKEHSDEIIIVFDQNTIAKFNQRCGDCSSWSRGGIGSGKGGGYCFKWKIPKVASNTCGKFECWTNRNILSRKEKE